MRSTWAMPDTWKLFLSFISLLVLAPYFSALLGEIVNLTRSWRE